LPIRIVTVDPPNYIKRDMTKRGIKPRGLRATRADFPRTQSPRAAAESTKDTSKPRMLAGMPGAGLTNSMRGQARPDRPTLKPYR
jgi:hypothetical protein